VIKKVREITKVLLEKGLREETGKHHIYYWFFLDGKKTSVNTYFSHSASEANDFLLSQISKQLKFQKKDHLLRFIDCYIDEPAYTKMLLDGKYVRREENNSPNGKPSQ
jgi:hypothetical protein